MPQYVVEIERTEYIAFEVEADSAEDAEARYLVEGDEVASDTLNTNVIKVTQGTTQEVIDRNDKLSSPKGE